MHAQGEPSVFEREAKQQAAAKKEKKGPAYEHSDTCQVYCSQSVHASPVHAYVVTMHSVVHIPNAYICCERPCIPFRTSS